ncbi:MAG: hypothetical protein ABI563_06255 [Specibacter sp.]
MTGPREGGQAPATLSVLIVCAANLCRSPLIAFAAGRAGGVITMSAGLLARDGMPMCPMSATRISLHDGGARHVESFRSRALSSLDLDGFDLLLTATTAMRSDVVKQHPKLRGKTFTVLETLALGKMPLSGTELDEVRSNGPAAVMFARRGTVSSSPARRRALLRSRENSLDISDGHTDRGNRHHLATADLAERAGSELGTQLRQWQGAAVTVNDPGP